MIWPCPWQAHRGRGRLGRQIDSSGQPGANSGSLQRSVCRLIDLFAALLVEKSRMHRGMLDLSSQAGSELPCWKLQASRITRLEGRELGWGGTLLSGRYSTRYGRHPRQKHVQLVWSDLIWCKVLAQGVGTDRLPFLRASKALKQIYNFMRFICHAHSVHHEGANSPYDS